MTAPHIAAWPDFDFSNFRALMDEVETKFGGNTALFMPADSGRSAFLANKQTTEKNYLTWTHADFWTDVRNLARYFIDYGIGRNEAIAVSSENRVEWIIVYFASVIADRIIVPIDLNIGADEVRTILGESKARLLFASEKLLDKVRDALRSGSGSEGLSSEGPSGPEPCVEAVICFDDLDHIDESVSFSSIMEKAGTPELLQVKLPEAADISEDATAALIYTSGTTGLAKGVMLSHKAIIANANASILSLPIDESDVFVGVLPFHHTYPTTCCIVSPLMVGGAITIIDRLVGHVIIETIRDTGGTVFIGVPILFDKIRAGFEKKLRELPAPTKQIVGTMKGFSGFINRTVKKNPGEKLLGSLREKAGLITLRLMVSGGGPLSKETARFFESLGFTIRQGYGMSENGPLISVNTIDFYKHDSVGLPVKYTDIRISDPNEDGVGEIQVKSPSLMKGYFNNPEATQEMFTDDGYLRTGDLGYFDDDGYLYITGRSKNLIVTSGGKNVYPEEIEQYFDKNPEIAEIMVIGEKESALGGERVAAVVHPDYEYLEEEYGENGKNEEFVNNLIAGIIKQVNSKLPGYKKIDRWIIRTKEFEKTSSKKIKRYLYKNPEDAEV